MDNEMMVVETTMTDSSEPKKTKHIAIIDGVITEIDLIAYESSEQPFSYYAKEYGPYMTKVTRKLIKDYCDGKGKVVKLVECPMNENPYQVLHSVEAEFGFPLAAYGMTTMSYGSNAVSAKKKLLVLVDAEVHCMDGQPICSGDHLYMMDGREVAMGNIWSTFDKAYNLYHHNLTVFHTDGKMETIQCHGKVDALRGGPLGFKHSPWTKEDKAEYNRLINCKGIYPER